MSTFFASVAIVCVLTATIMATGPVMWLLTIGVVAMFIAAELED